MASFGLDLARKLLEDVDKEQEAMRGFATPAKPRLSVQPDGPEMNLLGQALMRGLTEQAMRMDDDPVAIVDSMMHSKNPARIIAADMMSGLGAILSGQPFQMTRQRLMARELTRAEFNLQRDKQLGAVFGQILDYQQGIADTESRSNAVAMQAQSDILGVAEGKLDREETFQNKIDAQEHQGEITRQNQIHATEEAVRKEQKVRLLPPTGLDDKVEYHGARMTDPLLSEEERSFSRERFDALNETRMQLIQQDEEAKRKVEARFRVPPDTTQMVPVTQQTPYGTQTAYTVVDKRNGNILGRTVDPLSFKLSDSYQKDLDSAVNQTELLTEISGLADTIDDTAWTQIQNQAASLLSLGAMTSDEVAEFIKKNDYQPGSTEARLFQLMGQLTAERVVEFTGAQATDNERQFIAGTMPQLLKNANTFKSGISLLKIYADWKTSKLTNRIVEDAPNFVMGDADPSALQRRPFDVGRAMAYYAERVEEDPDFLEGKTGYDLYMQELSLRAQ